MIIGVTGPICAGTDTFGEILKKQHGYSWFAYSDLLREEAKNRGTELTRTNLQDLGDELRKTQGPGVLSKLLIEKISEDQDYVVGGIRNPAEVEVLREKFGDKFKLILINASKETRFKRLLNRRREKDPETFEGFLKLEERELGTNTPAHCLKHKDVFPLAEKTIENESTIEDLAKRVQELIEELNVKT